MEKKIFAVIISIGTIVGGVIALASRYETKEEHRADIQNVERSVDLKLENAVLRIENKLDRIEAQHHAR